VDKIGNKTFKESKSASQVHMSSLDILTEEELSHEKIMVIYYILPSI